jgi:hypothetical protein
MCIENAGKQMILVYNIQSEQSYYLSENVTSGYGSSLAIQDEILFVGSPNSGIKTIIEILVSNVNSDDIFFS